MCLQGSSCLRYIGEEASCHALATREQYSLDLITCLLIVC